MADSAISGYPDLMYAVLRVLHAVRHQQMPPHADRGKGLSYTITHSSAGMGECVDRQNR